MILYIGIAKSISIFMFALQMNSDSVLESKLHLELISKSGVESVILKLQGVAVSLANNDAFSSIA